MIAQKQCGDKDRSELVDSMVELQQFVQDAAQQGVAAHECEHALFRRLLALGHRLFDEFLTMQGSGDVGEEFILPDGHVLQRDVELHDREYTNIFGTFTLWRTVYTPGPHQELVVPLDARL